MSKINNALIAQKLLGCKVVFGGNTQPFDKCGCEDNAHSEYDIVNDSYYRLKNYYTSRIGIWQVIDAMESKELQLLVEGPVFGYSSYYVRFFGDRHYCGSSESFTAAVCDAAIDYLESNNLLEDNNNVN